MPILPRRVSGGTLATYPIGPLHTVTLSEAVDEFRGRYGGEWRIAPMEPSAPGTAVDTGISRAASVFRTVPYPAIGHMVASSGRLGFDLSSDIIFEYGTRRGNVASYTFNVDRQQVANAIYVPRVGFPEPGRVGTTDHAFASDEGSYAAMSARYDAWVEPGDIQLLPQRQALADFHRNLRMAPRRIVSFVPTVNAEIQPWVDYNVGDFVRFRALDTTSLRLDVTVRIYGITANLDNQGNESITLTTAQESTT